MTILDSVQELQENSLCQDVISDIVAVLGDISEKITFGAKFDNDICAISGM